jgi:hypothetical protein
VPAPFTTTVRDVEVPTVAIGVFEVEPGETEETVAGALAAGYRSGSAGSGTSIRPWAPDWRE